LLLLLMAVLLFLLLVLLLLPRAASLLPPPPLAAAVKNIRPLTGSTGIETISGNVLSGHKIVRNLPAIAVTRDRSLVEVA